MSIKLGVYICTSRSPMMLRSTVAQMMVQTRKPDVLAIHQNGLLPEYKWAFEDLVPSSVELYYRNTKGMLEQPCYYTSPLISLYKLGCTYFAKVDDDDMFYINHLEELLNCIVKSGANIVAPRYGDVLIAPGATPPKCIDTIKLEPEGAFFKNMDWSKMNPTGSMSDSVIFDRDFAKEYIKNLMFGLGTADDVLMAKTMKGFKVDRPEHSATACYITHGLNTSGDIRGNPKFVELRKEAEEKNAVL